MADHRKCRMRSEWEKVTIGMENEANYQLSPGRDEAVVHLLAQSEDYFEGAAHLMTILPRSGLNVCKNGWEVEA